MALSRWAGLICNYIAENEPWVLLSTIIALSRVVAAAGTMLYCRQRRLNTNIEEIDAPYTRFHRWTSYLNPCRHPAPPSPKFQCLKAGPRMDDINQILGIGMDTYNSNIEIQWARGKIQIMHLGSDSDSLISPSIYCSISTSATSTATTLDATTRKSNNGP